MVFFVGLLVLVVIVNDMGWLCVNMFFSKLVFGLEIVIVGILGCFLLYCIILVWLIWLVFVFIECIKKVIVFLFVVVEVFVIWVLIVFL